MPVVRITLLEGKPPAYLAAVSQSIYDALREQFVLAEGDKFHIFEQMNESTFVFDRNFVSPEPRTDDFMIIQVEADARREVEKTATYKAICDKLAISPGVKPQDIAVVLNTRNSLEDFSLGYGKPASSLLR